MATESMIKRVARNICLANQMDPDAKSHIDGNASHWEDYIKDARAAIEAMREPTEAMDLALKMTMQPPSGFDHPDAIAEFDLARAAYAAMIDEALK